MGFEKGCPTSGILADGDGVQQPRHFGASRLHLLQGLQQVPGDDAPLVDLYSHRLEPHGDDQRLRHVRVGVLLAQDGVPLVHEQPHQHLQGQAISW